MNSKKVRILKHVLLSISLCGSLSGIVSSLEATASSGETADRLPQPIPEDWESLNQREEELSEKIAKLEEQIEKGGLYRREAELQVQLAELKERFQEQTAKLKDLPQQKAKLNEQFQAQRRKLEEELAMGMKPIYACEAHMQEKLALEKRRERAEEGCDKTDYDRLWEKWCVQEKQIKQETQENPSPERLIKLNHQLRAIRREQARAGV
jgi:uncharacterized protein YlxW (UPF0749 family)